MLNKCKCLDNPVIILTTEYIVYLFPECKKYSDEFSIYIGSRVENCNGDAITVKDKTECVNICKSRGESELNGCIHASYTPSEGRCLLCHDLLSNVKVGNGINRKNREHMLFYRNCA